ncbi:hypothetical protein [Paenibacillus sp. KN14-4R]|uniref:hypothetical protein n=1 Tax=Paenibacillus sp. KN14-4R TaxID=3445773 RepID=UPI003FA04864
MKKTLITQAFCTVLVVTLSIGTVLPVANASDDIVQIQKQELSIPAPVFQPVIVDKVGTFELKNIQFLAQPDNNNVTFTVSIRNDGDKDLMLIDYFARLKTKSGQECVTRLMVKDKDKKLVKPGTTQEISYYAQVDESVLLHDLTVEIAMFDFKQPRFEKSLGMIDIPDTYSQAVPAGGNQIVSVGGTQMKITVPQYLNGSSEKNHLITVYVQLENIGKKAAKSPEYQFVIRSADGTTYPLESKTEGANLRPKETLEWRLTGTVPVSVKEGGWQLDVIEQVSEAKAEKKLNVSAAVFKLPESKEKADQSKKRYSFSSKSGIYEAELNGIYRAPWEDRDIVTADMTIFNQTDKTMELPELKGYFLLENKVKVPADLVQMTQSISIRPNEKVSYQAVGKLPLSSDFSTIKLVLQESEAAMKEAAGKEGEGVGVAKAVDLLEFPGQLKLQPIKFNRANDFYTVLDTGRKARYQVVGANRYYGNANDIFAVQMEVENLDKRPVDATRIVAQMGFGDGSTLPTHVSEIKSKIAPDGKAMLEIWSDIPKNSTTTNLEMVIGDAVSQGKLVTGDAKPDAYVKPAGFWLPNEEKERKGLLKMEIYPYSISIKNIQTDSKDRDFNLKFDSEIVKTKFAEVNTTGHKLVLSVVDSQGFAFYENALDVNDFTRSGSNTQGAASTLRVGKNQFMTKLTNPDADFGKSWYKAAKLMVYDEFQGYRKLLATENIMFTSKVEEDKQDR